MNKLTSYNKRNKKRSKKTVQTAKENGREGRLMKAVGPRQSLM
jgi:hypothetical protein